MRTSYKEGDAVYWSKAKIPGLVISPHPDRDRYFVELHAGDNRWVSHYLPTQYLEKIKEADIPDILLSRRTARVLLGKLNILKKERKLF